MIFTGDDTSYFAYATSFAFGTYPHVDKEFADEFGVAPLSRIGPGLMAAPFVFVGSLIDRAVGNPIVEKRTAENNAQSWSAFFFMLSTIFYFYLAGVILFRTTRRFYSDRIALFSTLLMIVPQGIALYAFRRPIFAHIPELLLQSLFVYLFVREIKGDSLKKTRLFGSLIVLSALAMMVRQNSIVYALAWPILILTKTKIDFKKAALAFASFSAALAFYKLFKSLPIWINPAPYEASNKLFETSDFLFKFEPLYFYIKRTWTVLLGADWGLVYTAPFLILGAAGLFLKKLPHQRAFVLAALPLLVNFYILIIWKGQGSYYGYRYILFAAVPVLLIPLAAFVEWFESKTPHADKILIALAIPPLLSMLLFEGSEFTTLAVVTTEFGEKNGGNLTYQLEVWKVVLSKPAVLAFSLFKNGPAYLVYLAAKLFGMFEHLPAKLRETYDVFDKVTLVRTIILYALPACFLRLLRILPKH